MQIRFISGLTAEDEDQIAPALLRALTTLLDQFALAYTLRIETSGNKVFQHSQPARSQSTPPASEAGKPAARRPPNMTLASSS
jgi:hypothetical protein